MVTLKTINKIRKEIEGMSESISKTELSSKCKLHPYAVDESLPILEELGVCKITRLNRISIIIPTKDSTKINTGIVRGVNERVE